MGQFWNWAQLAFPDGQDCPAGAAEVSIVPLVAVGIPLALALPICGVGFGGNAGVFAGVEVPEATVDVDDFAVAPEDDVWGAGEIAAMEAEAVAEVAQKTENYVGDGPDVPNSINPL